MRPLWLIALWTVVVAVAIGLPLALSGLGEYDLVRLPALLVACLLVSLVDPVRFYATDVLPPQTRLGRLLLRAPRR